MTWKCQKFSPNLQKKPQISNLNYLLVLITWFKPLTTQIQSHVYQNRSKCDRIFFFIVFIFFLRSYFFRQRVISKEVITEIRRFTTFEAKTKNKKSTTQLCSSRILQCIQNKIPFANALFSRWRARLILVVRVLWHFN